MGILISSSAHAQTLESCKKIQGAVERLACFDKLPVPLKVQVEKPSSTRDSTNAAEVKRRKLEEDEAAMAKMPAEAFSAPCILAAAEHLPRIPGISIEASRAVPLSPQHKKVPGVYQMTVEIDARGAGVAATYRFLCTGGLRGPVLITSISG